MYITHWHYGSHHKIDVYISPPSLLSGYHVYAHTANINTEKKTMLHRRKKITIAYGNVSSSCRKSILTSIIFIDYKEKIYIFKLII